jgi:hypothetical protein
MMSNFLHAATFSTVPGATNLSVFLKLEFRHKNTTKQNYTAALHFFKSSLLCRILTRLLGCNFAKGHSG